MLKSPIRFIVMLADTAAIPLALFFAYWLRYGNQVVANLAQPASREAVLVVVGGGLVCWLTLYEAMSLDSFSTGWSLPATVSRMALAVAIQLGAILALAYLARVYFSRLIIAYFAVTYFGLVLLARVIARDFLRNCHRFGKTRRMVIVGDGKVARELTLRIRRHPELLYEVVGHLNPWTQSGNGHDTVAGADFSGLSSLDVLKYLEETHVQELIVCMDQPSAPEVHNFLARCLAKGMRVSLVPQPYELYCSRARLIELDGVPLVAVEGLHYSRTSAIVKRWADLILGVPLSLLALPILAVSSLVIKCRGRIPWRRELRGGQYGEPFRMFRLNVEPNAAEATGLERLLCRLSISELPQLLNVLSGEMSLVGPRPETLKRVEQYSEWQRQRLNVRPGMTGLAQVNGLREQHPSEEKARYDLQYIVRRTSFFDLVLLIETFWTLAARMLVGPKSPKTPRSKSGTPVAVFSSQATQ